MDQNAINAESLATWQEIARNKMQANSATVAMKEVIQPKNAQKEIAKIICSVIDVIKLAISPENAKVKLHNNTD